MTIDSIASVAAPPTHAAANQGTTIGKISSDFETFLKMLTAQMRNQDPLNPVDSSDYAVQLATFASVEQQVLTNDLLKGISGATGSGLSDLASWIGMKIRTDAPARFADAPVEVWVAPEPGADRAELVVTNMSGFEVDRIPVRPEKSTLFHWDGKTSTGQTVINGTYRFKVESHAEDQMIGDSPAPVYAHVIEARRSGADLVLVTTGGHEVLASQVDAVRQK